MNDQLVFSFAEKLINGNVQSIQKVAMTDPNLVSPLVLAYIGDSVYELFVRTRLVIAVKGNVNKLHRTATGYSKSASQADVVHHILDMLTEKEHDIVRRGRNARSGYVPKNANVTEYRYATGFEALLGYLYLTGEVERLIDILNSAVKWVEDKDKDDTRENG